MAEDYDVDFIISLVEARPVLWDKTKEEYKNKILKTEAWKDVCQNIVPSFNEKDKKEKTKIGNEIVKKWTNVKDNFTKYMKKVELSKKSGAGAKYIKEYHLYKQLMFLYKNAPNLTDSSIEEEETSTSDSNYYQAQATNYQSTYNSSTSSTNRRRETSPDLDQILSNSTDTQESEYDFS
ncbi:hypothetical protein MSG28_009371 [Choristoneura fumiferana]|uniref:Uncharacterized protein n=1 Tax=Choristoneura fumiferana TaxID=7141 RepID=A0ACC0KY50_CHOFU|nr:hypothetical protein MSG28_009371 [Choristoneura fumiferana]